jgi:hypothetical protein
LFTINAPRSTPPACTQSKNADGTKARLKAIVSLLNKVRIGALSWARLPNGLEVRDRGVSCKEAPLWESRPTMLAGLPSLYARLAVKASVRFRQLGGSAPPSC